MDKVDLALVLAIDGSASVGFDEFNRIASGLGEALRDPGVVRGLTGGPSRASLACLLLWSGPGAQDLLVDWTRIGTAAEAQTFAKAVENMPRTLRPGTTAIGEALAMSLALLARAPAAATRNVVDVAGDGRSNAGIPPGPVRDRMVLAGVVINGLCVLHEEPDLVESYRREVIGGRGSFALPCPDYGAFAEAMRRKLLREVSGEAVA